MIHKGKSGRFLQKKASSQELWKNMEELEEKMKDERIMGGVAEIFMRKKGENIALLVKLKLESYWWT